MYVKALPMIRKARRAGYAIPAFNVSNIEIIEAVIEAAEEAKSPAILQATEKDMKVLDPVAMRSLIERLARKVSVPLALHLDHGKNYDFILECIHAGFSSVMVDASALDYEANVAMTKKVVQRAHARHVAVQAELGSLLEEKALKQASKKDLSMFYTDPMTVRDFVKRTGIDTLAIAIGNLHGIIKYQIKQPQLDFPRLALIRKQTSLPLVMHGSSKIPSKDIRKLVREGMSVFNFRTEDFVGFTNALRKELRVHPKEHDPREYLPEAIMGAKKVMREKMKLLGSFHKV